MAPRIWIIKQPHGYYNCKTDILILVIKGDIYTCL